jgi:transposase
LSACPSSGSVLLEGEPSLTTCPKDRDHLKLLADRGYDSDGFRAALEAKGITACIPPRKNRKVVIAQDKTLYRQRHRIENAFGRLKGLAPHRNRYDRCAHTCFSAICIAATVIFWIG